MYTFFREGKFVLLLFDHFRLLLGAQTKKTQDTNILRYQSETTFERAISLSSPRMDNPTMNDPLRSLTLLI